MIRARLAWVLIVLLVSAAGVSSASKAEKNFKKLSAEILQNLQEFWPVYSTAMGVHDYDGRFADYSKKSVDKQRKQLRKFLARLYKYKSVRLPHDVDIDRRLLRGNCEIAVLRLLEVGYHKINPNLYITGAADGIYYILVHDYKPLKQRLDDIIARMNDLPRFLEQGRSNLESPPPLWLEYAKENIVNVIDFYRTASEQLSAQFPQKSVQLQAASARAITALTKFQKFLDTLVPGDPGSFAIGKDYFDYILKHEYFYKFDSDSLLKIGEKLLSESISAFNEYQAKMEAEGLLDSADIFVPQSISRRDILDYYNWEIETVKRFFEESDLLTIPADIGVCRAVETPIFLQGVTSSIAYEPPGPFDDAREGYFYVQPIPEELTAEEKEYYYRRMHNRRFRGSVVHEAYPGHHLQIQLASGIGSDVRRWQRSNSLIEGWALYCEELAFDAGLYEDDPASYLRVLWGVIFRAARIIVDVKLHNGQFDYDQAVSWMTRTLDTGEGWIKKEVLRYTTDPGQPMSYLMGKRAIMDLREVIKMRESDSFSLKSFHDRLLGEGSIPVSLIREKMLR